MRLMDDPRIKELLERLAISTVIAFERQSAPLHILQHRHDRYLKYR